MTEHRIVVEEPFDGERADKIVATVLDVSRTAARSAFDAGEVTSGGNPLRPADRLTVGSEIDVTLPDTDRPLEGDAGVPFDVLFEDDDLLVVDKPIGVVVHPTSDRSVGTLVHGLIERYPDVRGVGQDGRWGIVHRLDRDTSGLLVVARTHEAYAALSDMIRQRAITRRYLTVVDGPADASTGTIEAPIGRDPRNPTRMRLDRSGRPAVTHYRRLAEWESPSVSLLSATLETGRTHQIRVHMQAIGHPIIGDRAYGKPGTVSDPGRPWLHARQLVLEHPTTGVTLDVVAALPEDLADSLNTLGAPTRGALTDIDGSDL